MPGFFARHYYCHACKKAYDHLEDHVCPNECKCCGFSPFVPKGPGEVVKIVIGSSRASNVTINISNLKAAPVSYVRVSSSVRNAVSTFHGINKCVKNIVANRKSVGSAASTCEPKGIAVIFNPKPRKREKIRLLKKKHLMTVMMCRLFSIWNVDRANGRKKTRRSKNP